MFMHLFKVFTVLLVINYILDQVSWILSIYGNKANIENI